MISLKSSGLPLALAGAALLFAGQAQAATVVWDFNLPATSIASQSPPYPSVATLTLVDTVDGVQFTLDPNESNPGFSGNSTIDALSIVYSGANDLLASAYQFDSGAQAEADSFSNTYVAIVPPPGNAPNLDTNYTSQDGKLKLTWSNNTFSVFDTAVWTILGASIAENFSIFATSNSMPSPIFGIISVSDIALTNVNPTPSNWVAPVTAVPVPAALPLLAGALGLFGFVARRRKRSA